MNNCVVCGAPIRSDEPGKGVYCEICLEDFAALEPPDYEIIYDDWTVEPFEIAELRTNPVK